MICLLGNDQSHVRFAECYTKSLSVKIKWEPKAFSLLSDRGRGAAVIRSLGKEPLWLRLFNRAYDALDAQDKEIVDALFVDMRPAVAARIANTNRQRVYRVIARFRELLIPAFREWKSR